MAKKKKSKTPLLEAAAETKGEGREAKGEVAQPPSAVNPPPAAADIFADADEPAAGFLPPRAAFELQDILIDQIDVSHNPRKNFDAEGLKELAITIRGSGVISPVVVNANDDGTFELLDGERRIRATRMAHEQTPAAEQTIEAKVYHGLTDQQKADIRHVATIAHKDFTPIELARSLADYQKTTGLSAAKIARRWAMSADRVQKLLLLTGLCEPVAALVDSGRLPVKYAEKIARVGSEKDQISLAGHALNLGYQDKKGEWFEREIYGLVDDSLLPEFKQPFHEFMREVETTMLCVNAGGWPVDVEFAGMRACIGCPSHSATIAGQDPGALIGTKPEGSDRKGYCLNGECYAVKLEAQEKVRENKKKEQEEKKQAAIQRIKAAGGDPCQVCAASNWEGGVEQTFEKFQGKRMCPDCKKKAEKAANRNGGDYENRFKAAKEMADRFPETLEQKYAVAMFKYAKALRDVIGRHLARLSKADCEKNLPLLVYMALGHAFFGTSAKLMPKSLLDVATGKYKWTSAAFAALWKSANGRLDQCEPGVSEWEPRVQYVPLPEEFSRPMESWAALVKLWKVNFDRPKPRPEDFGITAAAKSTNADDTSEFADDYLED